MRKEAEFPSPNELVVCTVTKVFEQGAFVTLEEYGGKEGMIYLKEIASGWIRNIRDHVREGQRVVCRVLAVDERKGSIDLSLRRVTSSEKKLKLSEFEAERNAEKLLLLVAKKLRRGEKKAYEEAGFPLIRRFGSLHRAFTEIARTGGECLKELKLGESWSKALCSAAQSMIKPTVCRVTGELSLRCIRSDGIEVIKNVLIQTKKSLEGGGGLEFYLVGSPRYRVVATGSSYKEAEELLERAAQMIIQKMKEAGGEAEFRR
ncbi:MAG: translation initiation factor IF-2 subunit alpha [Candidatus Hadarchaeales archaeon]